MRIILTGWEKPSEVLTWTQRPTKSAASTAGQLESRLPTP